MVGEPKANLLDAAGLAREAARLVSWAQEAPARRVLGIAGLPGSGKSTLAERLWRAVESLRPGLAVVAPMDGFHLRNGELDRLALRWRKGAPETFDAEGYLQMLGRARRGESVCCPIYDRKLHEPRVPDGEAGLIPAECRLVITEGNYLLLDELPWSQVAPLLDEAWWLDVATETAVQRLLERHQIGGRSQAQAHAHFHRSDRLNIERILACRRAPDRVVECPQWRQGA